MWVWSRPRRDSQAFLGEKLTIMSHKHLKIERFDVQIKISFSYIFFFFFLKDLWSGDKMSVWQNVRVTLMSIVTKCLWRNVLWRNVLESARFQSRGIIPASIVLLNMVFTSSFSILGWMSSGSHVTTCWSSYSLFHPTPSFIVQPTSKIWNLK